MASIHSARSPFTVAIASAGRSSDPAQWSGVPRSVSDGLRAAGAEVVALDVALPGRMQRVLDDRLQLRHLAAGPLSRLASRRLRRIRVDGVCQMGSEFVLETSLPLVTFEDMTVAQARRHASPTVKDLGSGTVERWQERQRRIFESATVCGAFATWTAKSIIDDYRIDPARVQVLGWGRNHTPPDGPRDWERPRFLFVGVDWQRKNGDAVVRAFTRLRAERPDARLDLVGGHPPLDVEGVVTHGRLRLDHTDERRLVEQLFASATCFVMPSWQEPSGIVFSEAAGAGLASIGTTVGGATDLITPECGIAVEPGDDEALFAAMRRMADPATARELGAAALARAELFTWRAVAERMLRALGAPAPAGREWAGFLG